jgi:2,3-bisphosphoglycerate-independent phosphoglycerate mutase
MKALLVIGDGMADRPLKELGGKTPLEVVEKPSLDWIAKDGICGILDPISPGVPPGSDAATLALLGYDALKSYMGRGALEALGSGVEILPGDVAFRCNFATVDQNLTVLDRRAGRIETEEASKFAETLQNVKLNGDLSEILFKNTVQHRAVLRIRGQGLSQMVSDSDPKKIGKPVLKVRPLENTAEATKTAKILNGLTTQFHEILKNHPVNKERVKKGLPPANIVLFRGAGTLPEVKPLPDQYGIKVAAVTAMPLIKGVCKVAGIKLMDVKGATGTYDTDIIAKAKAATEALESNDLVIVHVKATDIASHDGNIQQKIKMITKIDEMVNHIVTNIDIDETFIAITADHTTSSTTKEHEGDPVPIVIHGPNVRTDDVKEFSERACAKGGLCRIRGKDLMPIIMNLLGKAKKFGA